MSPRTTLLGLVALVAGLVTMVTSGGTAVTVVGVVLVTVGGAAVVAAGALGVRAKDPVKAEAAMRAKDTAEGSTLKRSGEQGQWQRTSAGL